MVVVFKLIRFCCAFKKTFCNWSNDDYFYLIEQFIAKSMHPTASNIDPHTRFVFQLSEISQHPTFSYSFNHRFSSHTPARPPLRMHFLSSFNFPTRCFSSFLFFLNFLNCTHVFSVKKEITRWFVICKDEQRLQKLTSKFFKKWN